MEHKLETEIRKGIKESGFPTELEVGKIYQNNGWEVKHSSYFVDLDENKGREIDIIANFYRHDNIGGHKEFHCYFVTEVKKEKEKPWVIFTTNSTSFEKAMGLPNTWNVQNFGPRLIPDLFIKYNQKLNLNLGRITLEAFQKGKDKIFSSLCNSTKAMIHAKNEDYVNKKRSHLKLFSYFEPLIVIDGILIEAQLNEKSEIILNESDYLQVNFNYLSPNYTIPYIGYIIHIVKKSYFDSYLKLRMDQFQTIFNMLTSTS